MSGPNGRTAQGPRLLSVYVGATLFAGLLLVWLSTFFQNVWLLTTGEGYAIPAESNVFAFQPTVMNDGSGDWWLYGQDARNYYRYIGEAERPYAVYERIRVAECPGFDPREGSTWCD